MKVLKSGIDFVRAFDINPTTGEQFLIKKAVPTGWAKLAKVTRVTKTQVEVEVINVIPTEESNKFGVKNGLKDRFVGFFKDWDEQKRFAIGKKHKFWLKDGVFVGDTNNWNPTVLAQLI
jgi:hypothetical protein